MGPITSSFTPDQNVSNNLQIDKLRDYKCQEHSSDFSLIFGWGWNYIMRGESSIFDIMIMPVMEEEWMNHFRALHSQCDTNSIWLKKHTGIVLRVLGGRACSQTTWHILDLSRRNTCDKRKTRTYLTPPLDNHTTPNPSKIEKKGFLQPTEFKLQVPPQICQYQGHNYRSAITQMNFCNNWRYSSNREGSIAASESLANVGYNRVMANSENKVKYEI